MPSNQSLVYASFAHGYKSGFCSSKGEVETICKFSKLTTGLVFLTVFAFAWSLKIKGKVTSQNDKDNRSTLIAPQIKWYKIGVPLVLNGWCTMTEMSKEGLNLFTKLSQCYGNTFQLPFGPLNVICTGDLEVIRAVLGSNDPHHLAKSGYIYKRLFVEEMHDGLFVAPYRIWLPQRKCMSRGFSYKSVLSYIHLIDDCSASLVSDIDTYISTNGKDLKDGNLFAGYLSTRLLTFTGNLLAGLNSCTSKEIVQIQESISTHKRCLLYVFQNPYLFVRPLWKHSSTRKVTEKASAEFTNALKQMIANYKTAPLSTTLNDNSAGHQPLIQLMLEENWTEKEILDNFVTFVFAEHEATFAAIQFALYHLATHPEHQTACRSEIDSVFHKLTATKGKIQLDINALSQLKYLERCMMESLRLFPPVPMFARRLGTSLKLHKDKTIKAGRVVALMPWILHRNPKIYPNPDKFDPDRFLPENSRSRPNYSYIPFSAGRRNCIAWKLSQIQVKTTLAWILRKFELSTKDKLEDFVMHFAVRIIPERNFNIEFKKRCNH